jgi:hypothetical protein
LLLSSSAVWAKDVVAMEPNTNTNSINTNTKSTYNAFSVSLERLYRLQIVRATGIFLMILELSKDPYYSWLLAIFSYIFVGYTLAVVTSFEMGFT